MLPVSLHFLVFLVISCALAALPREEMVRKVLFFKEEYAVGESGNFHCENLMNIYEIYNSTYSILSDIRKVLTNATIWDGGVSFAHVKNRNFQEVVWSETNINASIFNEDEIIQMNANNNGSTNVSNTILVAVSSDHNKVFKATLENMRVDYKDMKYTLCVRYLDAAEDYFEMEKERKSEFTTKFSIPPHIITTVFTGIFYNILIDTLEDTTEATFLSQPSVTTSFRTLEIAPPFSYYLRHDYDSGLIKLEHGAVEGKDLSAKWAWAATSGNNSNAQGYILVNHKEPNRKVIMNENGDLMFSSSAEEGNNLIFILSFNADKFTVWTTLDNETYCLLQFFGSTIRLIPISITNAETNPESKLCTRFKLQLGEVAVASGHHNTTFIDLYTSTQSSELIDDYENRDKPVERKMGNFMETHVYTTAILYFTSPPSALQLFLTNTLMPNPLQDLKSIADSYFEKGTVCKENQLESGTEVKIVLTCKLPSRHRQVQVDNDNFTVAKSLPTQHEDFLYRKNLVHETKVQVFRNYIRFQFIADGLKNCENEESNKSTLCTAKIIMSEKMVKDILNSMGIGYSNVAMNKGDDYLYYWSEGVITFSNLTVVPVHSNL